MNTPETPDAGPVTSGAGPTPGADTPGADTPGRRVVDPALVARLHRRMLVPNFPDSELITADELVSAVEAGTSTVRVVGAPEDPLAIAVTESYTRSPAVLLGYFATRADQRGRGIGSALLTGLLAGIATEGSGTSVVLAEVEHPGHHGVHPDHGDPAARLRFYGRLGGRILELPYAQPPVAAGSDPVYGMLLLVLAPPARYVRGDRLLPEAGLAGVLEEIMGGADPDRLPVAEALAAARDPRGTRMLPVADLAAAPVASGP